MQLPFITSLYGRIFAIFWFTLFLVLIVVLAIPHFDPRKQTEVPPERLEQLLTFRDQIESRFSHFNRIEEIVPILTEPKRFKKIDDKNKDKHGDGRQRFFLTDYEGRLLGTERRDLSYKAIRNFVSSIERSDKPMMRLYGRFMLSGPVPIKLADDNYFLYVGMKWNEPPLGFLIGLLDSPIRLLLATMLVSTPLLLWLAWALSQPARRLENAAKRVAKGTFDIDPKLEKGPSEFKQAGISFNHMVESVNHMISRQQRLLSDISHELRSPLTRLRMANALATRKQGESAELTRIDTEAQRLEMMIGQLLELSRMQVDSHNQRERQPLSSLWEALLVDLKFEAEQTGKTLTFDEVPERSLHCHPQLIISALENVVRNAIYYGKDKVQVSFHIQGNQLDIHVNDNGDGVPEEELKSIFRPFYRVSTARDRHSGGTGLGLAITENAIRQHNGTIKALKSPLGGLKVEISLPLAL
ncbi:envelope stress sensor histidine kinase CpxA [Marinomonas mediterranea]|uniref:envelope stress sensor histidine kinase CpxA n=1 Tax=Marinomonas mediterranea TaxID=119864 RepID=UPI00234B28D1|nr:envelope stress sensor histidine kinase CpxA [Marinomonas mediterranea]WCN10343.1 envelope stress sensor histidine kinase CpxA [Marinomonas mediterranea]